MAPDSNRIEGTRLVSPGSSRRAWSLVAGAGLLFVLVISGCASVNIDNQGAEDARRVDILIVTTDRATETELLGRLQGVESLPDPQADAERWQRGRLTGLSDGSVYTIVAIRVEGLDDMTRRATMWEAVSLWRPRYVLVLGTAPAAAYNAPLGAVGLALLGCDFDLDRYEELGDTGYCRRSDGGLYTAALSVTDEWKVAATGEATRTGCDPARVMKMAVISSHGAPGPRLVVAATKVSEERHRAIIINREKTFVADGVEDLRRKMNEPIGFLMIRGISEIRSPGTRPEDKSEASDPEQLLLQQTCAARDTADFAVELIRRRWPVSSRAKR